MSHVGHPIVGDFTYARDPLAYRMFLHAAALELPRLSTADGSIVRAVALDWRDFGEAEARERLAFELDSQGIWQGVGDDHCRLESAESGARRIHCAWDVEVQAWWGVFPMSFESEARMNPAGDLL